MTGLQLDILEAILRSQLDIENAVLKDLELVGYMESKDTFIKVAYAKKREIERQIREIEKTKK